MVEGHERSSSVDHAYQEHRRRFDWTETPPSTAIVETVAEATGVDPTAVPPMYDALDPDALDTLVGTGATDSGRSDLTVSFTVDDRVVAVSDTGEVAVRPAGTHR